MARSKRINGEGSWGHKTVNGKKYIRYRSSDGKDFYGSTQEEVKRKYQTYLNKKQDGIVNKNKMTIQEYALLWLHNTKKNTLKQQTIDGYETLINTWNLPDYNFGNVLTEDITDEQIQKWIDTMVISNYTLGTIRKNWSILRQCLIYGMAKHVIPHFELSLIILPSEEKILKKTKTVTFATIDDINALYKEANRKKEFNVGMANSEYTYVDTPHA